MVFLLLVVGLVWFGQVGLGSSIRCSLRRGILGSRGVENSRCSFFLLVVVWFGVVRLDYGLASVDSAAVSIFVVILFELTNT